MNKEKAKIILKEVVDVLRGYQIPIWLSWGSLLGAIRENDIIVDDDDLDIATTINNLPSDLMNTLKKEFSKKGYAFYRWQVQPMTRPRQMVLDKDGVHVDFCGWFYNAKTDEYYTPSANRAVSYVFPSHMLKNMKKVTFLDIEFDVPTPPELFLAYMYNRWYLVEKNRHANEARFYRKRYGLTGQKWGY